jgi:hypothetical protein
LEQARVILIALVEAVLALFPFHERHPRFHGEAAEKSVAIIFERF